MAQNGGGGPSSRRISGITAVPASTSAVPPIPIRSSTSMGLSVVPPMPPLAPTVRTLERDVITLSQPRPWQRAINEYIETPLRPQAPVTKAGVFGGVGSASKPEELSLSRSSPRTNLSGGSPSLPGVHGATHHHLHQVCRPLQSSPIIASVSGLAGHGQGQHHHHHQHHHPRLSSSVSSSTVQSSSPILSQPCATLKPDKADATIKEDCSSPTSITHPKSIFCDKCKLCTCDACRNPRRFPSTWICGNKYHCSAETTVDYCSCMCCVKGLLYHCTKDYEMDNDVSCADKPCSCSSHRRCLRWGCLSALTFVLPCLLCYWPLKGCIGLCEMCYTKCNSQGCQCRDTADFPTSSSSSSSSSMSAFRRKENNLDMMPNKRLLDSSNVE